MDKNAIKKYAVWARRELIARVSQKAEQYGITEKNTGDIKDESVNGRLLTQAERSQRAALIDRIRQEGYQQVMEEVAYTWFNRFCALRFMEVNNYLPTRIRVFTDEDNAFKPQILTEAIHMEMDGLDMNKVYQFKSDNKTEELYKYLLITQCNALYSILPGMFQQIADYTELLLPDNLLREGSVIEQMITLIPEEDWLVPEDRDKDSIQIIGWLYQYYNAEPKDQVFANLKKNIKISKHDIPAATQLFTPDWIVRYMVENSLGRLWVEGHPDDELKAGWKYYLEEAEQEPDVQAQLAKIREEYAAIKPEDIKCIDPCMGSGHILVYMFDVLVQIYQAYGYSTREAVQSIVENNLYGLDIDDRAAQLAYFAVMMKARQYDRRFFTRGIQPHVCAIQESAKMPEEAWGYFGPEQDIARRVYAAFVDAKEYGSLIEPNVTLDELDALDSRLIEMDRSADYGNLAVQALMGTVLNVMEPLMQQARMLVQKYDVVVTNPPYMGASNMNPKLNDYIKAKFPDYKSDFFSAFMAHSKDMCKREGYLGFFTPYVWLFIQSYEKLRNLLYTQATIETLIQFEYSAFEEATVPVCTLAFRNMPIKGKKGCYLRLTDFRGGMEVQRIKTLEAIASHDCGYYFEQTTDKFSKIPGAPMGYWLSNSWFTAFEQNQCMRDMLVLKKGTSTGDNTRFIRQWQEVNLQHVCFAAHNPSDALKSGKKWFPINGGGERRKWYGNRCDVVNWQNDGAEMKKLATELNHGGHWSRYIINPDRFFTEAIGWSAISSAKISARYIGHGFAFSSAAMQAFENKLLYCMALINSVAAEEILCLLAPTLNFGVEQVGRIPLIIARENEVESNVKNCIRLSRSDWDAFETSWDFNQHPLLPHLSLGSECVFMDADGKPGSISITRHRLEDCYDAWQEECDSRFAQLKANEEELNRIFIDIYGLQDELTPEVEDKNVTVRKADLGRDIRSFISYAVGCMFGRYSLSKPGLAFAGGEWDATNYTSEFQPDKDGILPISDDDYFTDDIVGRFVRFVEVVYGKETLEENLAFIAKALGGTGTPRDVIRSYFLNDFYADHLKIYQKRPIYWLFDSGKKNGFKALIYMHRYAPDTIARIRTDYVHEQQSRYRTAIADLENRIVSASTGERVKLTKQLNKVKAQAEELRVYEEKIHHLADQMIAIDLDDGVKVNYAKFADVLAKIK